VVDGNSGASIWAHWLSGDWLLSERRSIEDKEESESELGILKGRNFLNLNWTPFVGVWVLVWSRCGWSSVRVAANVDIDTLTYVQRLKVCLERDWRVGGKSRYHWSVCRVHDSPGWSILKVNSAHVFEAERRVFASLVSLLFHQVTFKSLSFSLSSKLLPLWTTISQISLRVTLYLATLTTPHSLFSL